MTGVSRALDVALTSVDTHSKDAAAVALARKYAEAIDADPELLWRIGPRLLDVLVELRMTPKARAMVAGTKTEGKPDDDSRRASLHVLREEYGADGAS